jgi:hypothetical protein
MKQTEQEKRNAVYDIMSVSAELRIKAENFASSGKTKTERNIRAGWYIGRHRQGAENEIKRT